MTQVPAESHLLEDSIFDGHVGDVERSEGDQTPSKTPGRRGEFGLGLAVATVVVLVFLPFAGLHLDVHHDGYMLKAAVDVADGHVLYRDTFMQYGPVPTWLQAGALEVLGRSLYSLRVLAVLTYGIAAGLMAMTWRRVLPLSATVAAIVFWVAYADFFRPDRPMYPWPSTVLLALQAAAIYARFKAVDGARRGNVIAGFFGFAAVLCRLTPGVALCAALLVTSRVPGRKGDAKSLVAGMGLAAAPVFVYLASTGSMYEFVVQTIVWPFAWATEDNRGIDVTIQLVGACWLAVVALLMICLVRPRRPQWVPWLLGGSAMAIAVLLAPEERLFAVAAVSGFFAVVLLAKGVYRRPNQAMTVLGLVLGTSALVQIYPVPDITHIWWSVGPVIGFAMALAVGVMRRAGIHHAVLATAAVALVMATPPAVSAVRSSVERKDVPLEAGGTLTKGMAASPQTVAEVKPILAALDRYPRDVPILTLGRDSFWAAFSTAGNPDPATADWAPDQRTLSDRAAYIIGRRPLIVTYSTSQAVELRERFGYVSVAETILNNWGEMHVMLLAPARSLLDGGISAGSRTAGTPETPG